LQGGRALHPRPASKQEQVPPKSQILGCAAGALL
jgi:hypothetical protein